LSEYNVFYDAITDCIQFTDDCCPRSDSSFHVTYLIEFLLSRREISEELATRVATYRRTAAWLS